MSQSAESALSREPLTSFQRTRLLLHLVPFLFFVGVLLAMALAFRNDTSPMRPFVLGFIGLILLFQLLRAVRALRDYASGVVLVAEDVVESAYRGKGYVARFRRLGRMTLTREAFTNTLEGARHRVAYSPLSKIAWRIERLDSTERE